MFISKLNHYKDKIYSSIYSMLYENYKGLTKNPKWLLMRKISRFKIARTIVYFLKRKSKISQLSPNESNSYFTNIDVDEIVNQLKNDGLALNINLPQYVVKEIVEFAKSTVCYGNRKSELGFYLHDKEQAQFKTKTQFLVAHYFNTALLCPTIYQLQNDTTLLAIAAKYLEREPVHQGSLLWWSFPGNRTYQQLSSNGQLFHYDLDDYRFIKFFFYLTDVDIENGPHICVRGSHKQKKLSHLILRKRETDEDIIRYYALESLVTICGQAGLGFVEDGFCFHKGVAPTHKNRLILQIEFATTDFGMQNDIRDPLILKSIDLINPMEIQIV
jgi:Phytanoyl-CoA dioxygenase (PhyH)